MVKALGRPIGSRNTDAVQYQEFFVKQKVVVPELELYVLVEAKLNYEKYKSDYPVYAIKYLNIYQNQIEAIANRIYPKLKSIDLQLSQLSDQMSEDEQIEFLTNMLNKLNERKQNKQKTPE